MTSHPNDYDADLAGFAVPSGPDPEHGRDELERLASDLAKRVRAGDTSDAPAAGSDELAARLRELAPAIEALERWKIVKEAEVGTGELPAALPIARLADCRLVREIGRGGNGIVFEAVQGLTWHRRVAVKVFPWRDAADGSAARRRFLDEASTLSRLRHRHIVPIYSYGSEGGYSHYVMRLAEGGSLDRVIGRLRAESGGTPGKETAMPGGTPWKGVADDGASPRPSRACHPSEGVVPDRSPLPCHGRDDWRWFAGAGVQIAESLAYAHAADVVHGDVKPANVLLDGRGRIMVTDFGPSADSNLDDRGRLAGTYRYMAPERFDGVCDERSDVYSLGTTLYELVTLTPAFEEPARDALVRRVLRHGVVAPRLLRADVPPDLESIILKSMARDPAERYRSATDVAADLLNFLRGLPVAARHVKSPGLRWLRFFRRRPS